MDPLEDALAEQRRRSAAMTAALRHARYAPLPDPDPDPDPGGDVAHDRGDDGDEAVAPGD